jgi:hypothetical protein
MFEIKYKKFDFREFMDFVLNLADRHGLGKVKFGPDNKELFDDYQLSHISPSRDVEDQRGFTWAWSKKLKEVRRVTFDQFSDDNKKQVNITIDLDKQTIKLNKAVGISVIIEEELAKKRFGCDNDAVNNKNWKEIIKKIWKTYKNETIFGLILFIVTTSSSPWWFKSLTIYIKETDIVVSINEFKKKHLTDYSDPSKVLDDSIYNVIQKMDELSTDQEKQTYIQNYSTMVTRVESGRILHATTTEGLPFLADIDVNSKVVTCDFNKKWRQKFTILGDGAYVQFHGVIDRYDRDTGKLLLYYCNLYYS